MESGSKNRGSLSARILQLVHSLKMLQSQQSRRCSSRRRSVSRLRM